MDPRSVDVSAGLNWYSCGWRLFMKAPAMWLVMMIIMLVIAIVLVIIPLVGQLALMLIAPALGGGFYFAVDSADRGGPVEPTMLFEGLRDPARRNPLLTLGALTLAVGIVGLLVMMVTMAGGAMGGMMMEDGPMGEAGMRGGIGAGWLLGLLLMLALELAVIMGMFYAIPLVMLRRAAPVAAVKASFSACFKNLLPLLVFGVVYAVLAIIAVIPLGLGLLLLIPVSLCAGYCSYKDIFGDQ